MKSTSLYQVLSVVKEAQKNVKDYLKDKGIQEIKQDVKAIFKNAPQDLSDLVEGDLAKIKQKFFKEKKQWEKLLKNVVGHELNKAKSFVNQHQSEIKKLQKKVEIYVQKITRLRKQNTQTASKTPVKVQETKRTAPAKKTTVSKPRVKAVKKKSPAQKKKS